MRDCGWGWRVVALALLAAAGMGCGRGDGGDGGDGGAILVAAASDLAVAMPELAEAFAARTGIRVTATLGSTGQLASQILQGAPVDVFLAADAGWLDRLEQAGRLVAGTRAVYAEGVLVMLAPPGTASPGSVVDLRGGAYARIALANPEHAPYGRAAEQALERAGVLPALQERLVLAENVRQTVQFAEAGAVDVALSALALMDSSRHRWTVVPSELHDPLRQTAAIIAGSSRVHESRAFIAFLTGEEGRAILRRYGFVLP